MDILMINLLKKQKTNLSLEIELLKISYLLIMF
nr:MAG TPA: hypothetical protein [Caudoviricetes sp.]